MLKWTKEKFVKVLQKNGIDQKDIDNIQMAETTGGRVRYRIDPGAMDFETEVKIDIIVEKQNFITHVQAAALTTALCFGATTVICAVADFVKGRRLKRNLKKQLKEEVSCNDGEANVDRVDIDNIEVNTVKINTVKVDTAKVDTAKIDTVDNNKKKN